MVKAKLASLLKSLRFNNKTSLKNFSPSNPKRLHLTTRSASKNNDDYEDECSLYPKYPPWILKSTEETKNTGAFKPKPPMQITVVKYDTNAVPPKTHVPVTDNADCGKKCFHTSCARFDSKYLDIKFKELEKRKVEKVKIADEMEQDRMNFTLPADMGSLSLKRRDEQLARCKTKPRDIPCGDALTCSISCMTQTGCLPPGTYAMTKPLASKCDQCDRCVKQIRIAKALRALVENASI